MTEYDDLIDAVEADPDLKTFEKETSFYFSNDDTRARFNTANPTLMRKALGHAEFELTEYVTSDGEVSAEEYAAAGHDRRRPVYRVFGTFPIGVLKVQATARSRNTPGPVVSDATPGGD